MPADLCTVPGILSISPLLLAKILDLPDTRGKWPSTRNPDRSWWHRYTTLKLFWPQPMAPWITREKHQEHTHTYRRIIPRNRKITWQPGIVHLSSRSIGNDVTTYPSGRTEKKNYFVYMLPIYDNIQNNYINLGFHGTHYNLNSWWLWSNVKPPFTWSQNFASFCVLHLQG